MLAAGLVAGVLARPWPVAQLLPVLANIPMLVLLFVMAVRRLNDMNLSGWLSLLGLIPGVNLVFWVGLLAAPGTQGANRHGPAPGKNTTAVLIAAWAGPIALVLSIGYTMIVLVPMIPDFSGKGDVDQLVAPAPYALPAP